MYMYESVKKKIILKNMAAYYLRPQKSTYILQVGSNFDR